MKTLLVTSQVTYTPSNYQILLEYLLNNHYDQIEGIVILGNFDFGLFRSVCGVFFLGATQIGKTLLKNIALLPFQQREKLFQQFQKKKITVLKARSMNDPRVVEWVKKRQIDLIFNLRTRCIYKKDILEAPRLGCLNIHHGILPQYRGVFCDLYALSEGRPAGFTVHVMTEKVDAGRILESRVVSDKGEKNYLNYLREAALQEAQAIGGILEEISKTGCLPAGSSNKADRPVYTKNPTRKEVKGFRKKGMVL